MAYPGMVDTDSAITCQCAVAKLQTLADGGIRVTLDLPETAIETMAKLAECKRVGVYLEAQFTPVEPPDKTQDEW